ncbi:twin-arginine translocase subunit TatC, partial [Ensifer sp. 2YAB10]
DPVSQIGLALPAILLYEISIYTARLVERQRAADALKSETAESQEGSSGEVGPAKG